MSSDARCAVWLIVLLLYLLVQVGTVPLLAHTLAHVLVFFGVGYGGVLLRVACCSDAPWYLVPGNWYSVQVQYCAYQAGTWYSEYSE